MKTGLREKYSQNKLAFDALESTEISKLVEASATDKLWGAGLVLNDPKLSNVQLWSGINWIGEASGKYPHRINWIINLFLQMFTKTCLVEWRLIVYF